MALEEGHALGEFSIGQMEDAFILSHVPLGSTFDTFALSVMRLWGLSSMASWKIMPS